MAALFPPEVDKVYLQPDLSIIAPGPLVAPIDERLRGFAEVEAPGVPSLSGDRRERDPRVDERRDG